MWGTAARAATKGFFETSLYHYQDHSIFWLKTLRFTCD